jgi:hypothetical protein
LYDERMGRRAASRIIEAMSAAFCTLAIHSPYRRRARVLCADLPTVPWTVLTDDPEDFAGMPVRAIRHAPTGPMAVDYLERLAPTGNNRGAAAYHDKRFALMAALEEADTAIFLDADCRIVGPPPLGTFPAGLSVTPLVRKSIAEHLETCGTWRRAVFEDLAREIMGDASALHTARWCHETVLAVTRDGREPRFFEAWGRGAEFLQARNVYSGEGGVIGLAAAYAGWNVDFDALAAIEPCIQHEGGGPKDA